MKLDYRLSLEDIKGDPECLVAVVPVGSLPDFYPSDESEYVAIPERIMWRIIGIAKAYDLHFSVLVSDNGYDRWVYRGPQIQTLEDELEFIFNLVNDEILREYINRIQAMVRKAIIQPNRLELAFEGP